MSHAGKRRHQFDLPGYCRGVMNDDLEKRVLIQAQRAFASGATFYEKYGVLFVRCGGRIVMWENADPRQIGKK